MEIVLKYREQFNLKTDILRSSCLWEIQKLVQYGQEINKQ
ncbi:hypothetical protein PL9631_470007 [Planktothrix paucivesiculata PCC 9631]|nr:hypothetical protein PL9631_1220006 [Planktothrix paucivesiculata PCC 9631]VXD19838.1 hypothetical protein PL9631_470007 [Planktothrix paucivesiculata PCC 9631]